MAAKLSIRCPPYRERIASKHGDLRLAFTGGETLKKQIAEGVQEISVPVNFAESKRNCNIAIICAP
jgi:hypothetical protein